MEKFEVVKKFKVFVPVQRHQQIILETWQSWAPAYSQTPTFLLDVADDELYVL